MTFDQEVSLLVVGAILGTILSLGSGIIGAFVQYMLTKRNDKWKEEVADRRHREALELQQQLLEKQLEEQRKLFEEQLEQQRLRFEEEKEEQKKAEIRSALMSKEPHISLDMRAQSVIGQVSVAAAEIVYENDLELEEEAEPEEEEN